MNRHHFKAALQVAAVCAAAAVAACAWATGLTQEGYLLEAADWRSEVAAVPSTDWPVDAWYRLSPGRHGVDVRAMVPSQAEPDDPDGALYVRVPGRRLVEGVRPKVRFAAGDFRPKVGAEYRFELEKVAFSFTVESARDGTRYEIAYAGAVHSYMLGLPASATRIRAIADFDGDRLPDFLVEVGDRTYLLLSTEAQPGGNLPSAQLWPAGC